MKKMALHHNDHQNPLFLLDCLYCEEQTWEDTDIDIDIDSSSSSSFLSEPTVLLREDDELFSLFSKERELHRNGVVLAALVAGDGLLAVARAEAVEWMLKVNAHYGFSSLTALLGINYLDRVLCSPHFRVEKPWMVQLLAVTCVSLAAKVEEIQVPLLLDLQVEDSKYIFESKTIQRMELLVLTSLKWKMHPVTPVSFLDLICKKLSLKIPIQAEFFRRCDRILLSLVSDSRSIVYLPSELAIATMVSVIQQMEKENSNSNFQDRLLNAIAINKIRVNECSNLISELSKSTGKRRFNGRSEVAGSPSGVVDVSFSSDSSNDSWAVGPPYAAAAAAYDYSPPSKRSRAGELLPSVLNRVLVDFVANVPP